MAKKSGTKKVYFPVHKYGFDRAYELAVQTRKVYLQNPKLPATGKACSWDVETALSGYCYP